MGLSDATVDAIRLPGGWLFLHPDAVPPRWRNRGVPVVMVPLMPGEAAEVLENGRAGPELDPLDEALARLVARGAPTESIAGQLGVSGRTAQRRISVLRRRLGAGSRGELSRLLAARGYAS